MLDGRDHCYAHDPTRRAEREAARRKGGENSATAARAEKLIPSHLRPVLGHVYAALRDVRAGTITPAQGSAIASLSRAAVAVLQAGIFEERVQALEDAQAAREGQGAP